MPSIRSRLFVFMLKHRHLLEGRLRRTKVVDWSTSIDSLREQVEKGAGFLGKLPNGFNLEPVDLNGLKAEWMLPPDTGKDKTILYFHGGGLVVGSIRAHRGIVAKFVKATGIGALLFNYALAPEHPYPAGLNDCVTVYRYLLSTGIAPERIVFMGDSGGGNLCLASLLALKQENLPLPAGAVTLSAWTDLTNSSPSFQTNARLDTLCWKDAQTVFSDYYVTDRDAHDPLISPLYGDLTGLPPLLLFAGEHELMRDDTIRFADRAEKAGVDVTLRIGKGLFHCYPACAPLFPEATEALKEIALFITAKIGEQERGDSP